MAFVQFEDVRFSYGTGEALRGLSFAVEAGSFFALMGPNGGGKTTAFRILCTLLVPLSGRVRVAGHNVALSPEPVRRLLGVVFQAGSLDRFLTVEENLVLQGRLYSLGGAALSSRIEEVLVRFGLSERRRQQAGTLSGGLQRRLELAKSLLHRPRLLVLDEPTAGLDPRMRRDFWSHLKNLQREDGMTILLTTHLIEEADQSDGLALIQDGRVVLEGNPQRLRESIGGDVVIVRTPCPEELSRRIAERFNTSSVVMDGSIHLEMPQAHEWIPRLVESFPEAIEAVTLGRATLEDVFVRQAERRFWE